MIDQELIRVLRRQFALDWNGVHGVSHWERVRENGLRLAPLTGAHADVVEIFAFVHDSKRRSEWRDPDHGPRAARFAKKLLGSLLKLDDYDFELLAVALRDHSDGVTAGDVTVLTCWDADRLDLGRVGIKPHPARLCTEAARDPELIEWAYSRSIRDQTPDDALQMTAGTPPGLLGRLWSALRARGG